MPGHERGRRALSYPPVRRTPTRCVRATRFLHGGSGAVSGQIEHPTPRLIVEVLLPRTAANDDGEKRINYQTLVSLEEYLLLDPTSGDATLYRRGGAFWTRLQCSAEDSVELRSIGLDAAMAWLLGTRESQAGMAAQPALGHGSGHATS
jgi:Uma2 family endonuclease